MIQQNLVLFDDEAWSNLLPLTYTKPVTELRLGISTIREKWHYYASNISWITQDYLSAKFPLNIENDNIFVCSNIIPTPALVKAVANLEKEQGLVANEKIIAFRSKEYNSDNIKQNIIFKEPLITIEHSWDIFEKNEEILRLDFAQITQGRKSEPISSTNNIIAPENIFIETGATMEFATIDASGGPVYIGTEASIMPGALIQGPLALCAHGVIKMGAKIYGATTIGPWCKAAGEIQNSVLSSYSNKGHDGYLGNSVLGEWCNIGADSNNSNLKNNYALVKLWDYNTDSFVNTGLQFCGLIMGDHSKCGINTMFNTGTVVGVSANIFGSGFPRNFIPSFSWGGAGGFSLYPLNKALETAEIVMARRTLQLSNDDKKIMEHIFNTTKKYRK
jgi:UDP-N-acetylglucosamine diphosphorylase/glucosamine-1-phosphate N-acetyltransferase